MLAAGGPIDGYWSLYKIHASSPTAAEELKKRRIGKLKEGEVPNLAVLDEFANEPERSSELVVKSPQPLNAGLLFLRAECGVRWRLIYFVSFSTFRSRTA